MIARRFVRAAVVALFATTGCASMHKESLSPNVVCAMHTQPAAIAVAVKGESIALGDKPLWSLPSDGPIDHPRAYSLTNGYAIAFRQGDAIWVGALDAQSTPRGELHRVGGQGRWLGVPSVRIDGDDVFLAWRDGDDVKLAAWKTSGEPEAPRGLDARGIGRFCDGATP